MKKKVILLVAVFCLVVSFAAEIMAANQVVRTEDKKARKKVMYVSTYPTTFDEADFIYLDRDDTLCYFIRVPIPELNKSRMTSLSFVTGTGEEGMFFSATEEVIIDPEDRVVWIEYAYNDREEEEIKIQSGEFFIEVDALHKKCPMDPSNPSLMGDANFRDGVSKNTPPIPAGYKSRLKKRLK